MYILYTLIIILIITQCIHIVTTCRTNSHSDTNCHSIYPTCKYNAEIVVGAVFSSQSTRLVISTSKNNCTMRLIGRYIVYSYNEARELCLVVGRIVLIW